MNTRSAFLLLVIVSGVVLLAPYLGVHLLTTPGGPADEVDPPLRWHPSDEQRPPRR